METVRDILKEFNLDVLTIERSRDTALSEVYVLDNTYILRGRPRFQGDLKKFENEQKLLKKVASLLPLSFPTLLPTKNKILYVNTETFLWTLYPKLKGEIISSWFNLKECPLLKLGEMMKLLKEIHSKTEGIFTKNEQSNFIEKNVKEIFEQNKSYFCEKTQKKIEESFKKVFIWRENILSETLCFTHNDFHPGNIIFNHGKPVGLIDLDWIKVGDPLEDLAYSVMMLIRLFEKQTFVFDATRFNFLLSSYSLEEKRREIFFDYLLLFAISEIAVITLLKNVPHLKEMKFYLTYQISMVEFLASEGFEKTASQSFDIASTAFPS